MSKQNAILVVSFGTSFPETRKKTIEAIENSIRDHFPDYEIYRAWTSGMIRKKLLSRDQLKIMDVKEAMLQMKIDGISHVIVQPTHVLNGIENEQMQKSIEEYRHMFESVQIGDPLLTSQEDIQKVIQILAQEFQPEDDENLVFMGHGTSHYSNSIYAALDYQFKDMGYSNIYMGTVEAYPSLDTIIRLLKDKGMKKVVLAPFMIVAGDHATNDLAGDEEDSWKSILQREGFEVSCRLKGLGEISGIQNMFLDHVKALTE